MWPVSGVSPANLTRILPSIRPTDPRAITAARRMAEGPSLPSPSLNQIAKSSAKCCGAGQGAGSTPFPSFFRSPLWQWVYRVTGCPTCNEHGYFRINRRLVRLLVRFAHLRGQSPQSTDSVIRVFDRVKSQNCRNIHNSNRSMLINNFMQKENIFEVLMQMLRIRTRDWRRHQHK